MYAAATITHDLSLELFFPVHPEEFKILEPILNLLVY